MTTDQITGLVRQVLPIAGTLLAALGFSSATSTAIVDVAMQISGPLIVIVGVIWAAIANTKGSIIQSVGGMDETEVKQTSSGVTIKINDPKLAEQAMAAQAKADGK